MKTPLYRIIVLATNKTDLMKELRGLNIHHKVLRPSVELRSGENAAEYEVGGMETSGTNIVTNATERRTLQRVCRRTGAKLCTTW